MTDLTLTKKAQRVVDSFLNLPFTEKQINCPYFNNRRSAVKSGLKVVTGKGSPEEIVEEANILSIRERKDVKKMSNDQLKKFLVDHNLGIDCSGFAYQLLDAQAKQKKNKRLAFIIYFPNVKNPIRRLIARLRPIENTRVRTLAHEKNSHVVKLNLTQPADMLISLGFGPKKDRDHIAIVEKVESHDGIPQTIHYVHSFQWSADGQYKHGVRRGKIKVSNPRSLLTDQTWIEQDVSGQKNETFLRFKNSDIAQIRRLN